MCPRNIYTIMRRGEDKKWILSKNGRLSKATAYIIFSNIAHKNSYENNKTPWEIICERNNIIKPEIAILPAINLQQSLN